VERQEVTVRITCPICKRVLDDVADDYPSRPFCSPRCKLADLHGWLNEEYRVSEPIPELEDNGRTRLN
jgi:endogenous inhibitor of DNA gyrase (YacG/DUF329 family)